MTTSLDLRAIKRELERGRDLQVAVRVFLAQGAPLSYQIRSGGYTCAYCGGPDAGREIIHRTGCAWVTLKEAQV